MSMLDLEPTEMEDRALAEYLQILRPTPAPRLAAGRARVLAEAARQEESRARWQRLFENAVPGFSFALVTALVLTGLVFVAAFAWSSTGSGSTLFGLFSTPTVAYTGAPAIEASETSRRASAASNEPTPQRITLTTTPAPIPTPQPTLTFLTTAQP
jgi:hypothetical protein